MEMGLSVGGGLMERKEKLEGKGWGVESGNKGGGRCGREEGEEGIKVKKTEEDRGRYLKIEKEKWEEWEKMKKESRNREKG
jgi:hypothetical protein